MNIGLKINASAFPSATRAAATMRGAERRNVLVVMGVFSPVLRLSLFRELPGPAARSEPGGRALRAGGLQVSQALRLASLQKTSHPQRRCVRTRAYYTGAASTLTRYALTA